AYAPENTLASFALAREMNADWFELDCTLTQDGHVIVIHDDKLDRTTNGKGHVSEFTLEALKRLDAGTWKDPKFAGERLPLLSEALDLAQERRIGVYIEIKNAADDSRLMKDIMVMAGDKKRMSPKMKRKMFEMIEASGTRNLELTCKVVALVRERRMGRQVVIQSFSPIACAIAQHEAPRFRVEMLALKDKDNPERWPGYLKWRNWLDVRGFNSNLDSLDEAGVKQCHAEGRMVAIWTVDDEDVMRQIAGWGVDRIITNKPDLCLRTLKAIGKH
ncbi:MAG: glycerophosphodiester phosphodiesterase family protein, partial [Candidatus Hydrogenedentes bacterium]|nr:glycerophosphodiester phosphodiesterase family protein [Candidatus Hydrogenedentota bacterium]